MRKNLPLNSINRGLAILLYRKIVVILYTKLLNCQQYTIAFSTMNSQNSQLIKIWHVARNPDSCGLLTYIDCVMDSVMLDF